MFVMSSAEVKEVRNWKICGCFWAKINREKGFGLRLGSWKCCAFLGRFSWTDGPCKIFGVWFGPNLWLEKNWLEVLEKLISATSV